jgi:hypothetical protein
MKNLKNFLSESPTNSVGLNGLTGAANASGPLAASGNTLLFKQRQNDLLSQDFQTPGESGLNKWELGSGVYPVEKLSMAGINNMVHASSQFVQTMDNNTENRIRKTFGQFKEHYLTKYKKSIQ